MPILSWKCVLIYRFLKASNYCTEICKRKPYLHHSIEAGALLKGTALSSWYKNKRSSHSQPRHKKELLASISQSLWPSQELSTEISHWQPSIMNTSSLSKEGWKKCPDSANPYKKIKPTSSRKHSSVSVKCITPGQEEFVSSHKSHTHVSRCSALPQQCAGTRREIWQSWHSTKHSPKGTFLRANGVCPRFHPNDGMIPISSLSEMTCARWHLRKGEESEKPGLFNIQMQEKLWNRYKCCTLVWDDAGLGFFSRSFPSPYGRRR